MPPRYIPPYCWIYGRGFDLGLSACGSSFGAIHFAGGRPSGFVSAFFSGAGAAGAGAAGAGTGGTGGTGGGSGLTIGGVTVAGLGGE
jgi:hypothetical protein